VAWRPANYAGLFPSCPSPSAWAARGWPSSPFCPLDPLFPPLPRSRGPAQVLQRGAPSFFSVSLTAGVHLSEHLLPRVMSKLESSSASTEFTRAIRDFHPNRRVLGLYRCSRIRRFLFFHLNSEPNAFNSSLGSCKP
jgi:hypothetical protein